MKALQIVEPGRFAVIELPVPEIGDTELLMEVEAVTTCPRWDILMYEGVDVLDLSRRPDYPMTPGWPGHEAAGTVARVGRRVSRYMVGDRIMAHTPKVYVDGEAGYAMYMRFREDEIMPVPDRLSYRQAAPFELLKCVVKGMNQFGDLRGKRVAVAGLGAAGLLAVQLARLWGAKEVYGVDISEKRIRYAEGLGFGTMLHADRLKEIDYELGFDCVGFSPSVQNLVDSARERVVVFGVLHGDVSLRDEHWRRGLKLECFDGRPLTVRELELAWEAIAHPDFGTDCIITHEGLLGEYDKAVSLLKAQEAIKVVFFPAGEFADADTSRVNADVGKENRG